MKRFNIKYNVGKVKYLVSYHDGEKKHKDGSDFFDIACFNNKKKQIKFAKELVEQGYKESNIIIITKSKLLKPTEN